MGGEKIITQITKIFNKILSSGRIPLKWKLSDIIISFKKGDRHKVTNYRPITHSPVIAKIFSKAIENRIRLTLIEEQPTEQAGFRSSFSTVDHICTVKQIMEKSSEYNKTIYIGLIDFNKAFDSLKARPHYYDMSINIVAPQMSIVRRHLHLNRHVVQQNHSTLKIYHYRNK